MALPIPKLTVEQYLAIERQAEYKSEFYNGEMFAMAGGTRRHSLLQSRFIQLLGARLEGRDCDVYTSDLAVRTSEDGLYTYPDVSVVCGEPLYEDDTTDVIINPKVIFEVLSPSTEAKDRGFKFHQYKQIATLEEYVLVSQSESLIERYGRSPGRAWEAYSEARGMDATLKLASLGIEIPLAEIYRGMEF